MAREKLTSPAPSFGKEGIVGGTWMMLAEAEVVLGRGSHDSATAKMAIVGGT